MSAPRRTSNTPATGLGLTSSFLTPGMVAAAASALVTMEGLGVGTGDALAAVLAPGMSPAQALTAARASAGIKRRRRFIDRNYTTRGLSAAGMVARVQFLESLAGHMR